MIFTESTHTYIHEGIKYDSATGFVKKFSHPFDSDKVSSEYAKKHGLTQEEVLAKWKYEGDLGAKKGTLIHKLKEDNLHESEVKTFKHEEREDCKIGFSIEQLQSLEAGIYPEIILYLPRYKICGTSDIVTIYEDKTFIIEDWKSNRELKTESFKTYNPKTGRREAKMMFSPFNDLEDCHLSQYTVQLSLYAYMLEAYGYTCKGLKLLHLDVSTLEDVSLEELAIEHLFITKETIYEVPYLREQISTALKFKR